MALLTKSIGDNRADRLLLASSILNQTITSFKDLDEDQIEILLSACEGWEKVQTARFGNGVLGLESMMVVDMIDGKIPNLTDKNYNISDNNSRKKYLKMKKMTQKDIRSKYGNKDFSGFASDIDTATKKLDDTIVSIPEANHGRWTLDNVIPAPTIGMGLALGTGGIPRGKIIHFYGAKHSGKSQNAYQIARMSQQQGIPVVIIDTEASMDSDFAENLGLDLDPNKLQIIMPGNIEELSNLLINLSGNPYTVIVDSIASTASKVELTRDRSKKEARVGGNAKTWADTLAVIRTRLFENGGTLVLINQVRADLNAGIYGDPEKPWGSEAIQHQVDISFKVQAVKEKKDNLKAKGYKISKLYMKKNRFDDMTDVTIELPFKPGYPYNRPIDITRYCDRNIASGIATSYGELAKNALRANMFTENGETISSKQGRYVLRVDPLLMAAIQHDEPGFDDVDIEPLKNWVPPEDDNFYAIDIPDVDENNSEYYNIPGLHEASCIKWMAQHPVALSVLEQRLLNGLNHKQGILDAENADGLESISTSMKLKKRSVNEDAENN